VSPAILDSFAKFEEQILKEFKIADRQTDTGHRTDTRTMQILCTVPQSKYYLPCPLRGVAGNNDDNDKQETLLSQRNRATLRVMTYRVSQNKISQHKNRDIYFTQNFPHLFTTYVFTRQFSFNQL